MIDLFPPYLDAKARGDAVAIRATESALVKHHDRLAHKCAAKYGAAWLDRDDAYASALIGLLKAIRTYDPARSSFSTHAVIQIRHEIQYAGVLQNRELDRNRAHRHRDKVRAIQHHETRTGTRATAKDIGVSERIFRTLTVKASSVSLSDTRYLFGEGEKFTVGDNLPAPSHDLDGAMDFLTRWQLVLDVVAAMPTEYQQAFDLLASPEEPLDQDIAKLLGVSRLTFQQMKKEIFEKVRCALSES